MWHAQDMQGLTGVVIISDGTEDEYISNLKALLQRARTTNVTLNKKKLKLRLSKVVYMEHHFTAKGVCPDPAQVKAVVEMPSP